MNRDQMLAALSDRSNQWDVVVIGGGATGLGVALDALSRGLKTLLVESHDFAKGTSSRSTKLVHGGVRYLRNGQVRMVRESLHERGRLLANAPHVVHPLQFVIPTYRTGESWFYYAGLKAYDLLAGKQGFAPSQLLSTDQATELIPTLDRSRLRGGVLYSDGQFDDARLSISLAQSIVDQGGVACNYMPVIKLGRFNGRTNSAVVRDEETGQEHEVQGRVFVNATGVFGGAIMQLDTAAAKFPKQNPDAPHIVPSRGSHLVLDRHFLPGDTAMLIPETDDGRVLFAIPWNGQTLIGTTDIQVEKIDREPRPTDAEIDYMLAHTARYLTQAPRREDVRSVFAGLRPLVGSSNSKQSSASLSREHEIHVSESGVISVIGGKWTTYRKMGEDVTDLVEKVGNLPKHASRTAYAKLHGAPAGEELQSTEQVASPDDGLRVYGSDAPAIREMAVRDPKLAGNLSASERVMVAQVAWAVEHEMARTVEDVLSRRTRLLLLNAAEALAAAEQTAAIMAPLLDKGPEWQAEQVATFSDLVQNYLV
ncbi:glycerol-3-phosphate dehydrogenase/oxidase [Aureliella helgolandensis]|uniref:Aerobic glycerol-3-phosphate dehydrogenase n=1 Tax=Aureliella helgolandensis TaxID=2527968 RepID=A0A518G5B7_9BACT|nr:glycerol-3-phosphate dehydrogenase/oxidase [Aureliella helgolandensis]QDV23786.1 Aerobic glycerol-3-phosphate dehydrogenase [Aureliella helgolandensis]